MNKYTYDEYKSDVLSSKIKVCKAVYAAVKRHDRDLNREKDPSYPYFFDPKEAEKVIDYLHSLKHYKGPFAGQYFVPEPWEQFIVAALYGWRKRKNGKRRFRKAYIQMARKNGKTFVGAGLQIHGLLSEPGAEVYSIATQRLQAKISFNDAHTMVSANKKLSELITQYRHTLVFENSKMEALSSEDTKLDGLNTSFCLVDEYHAHPNDNLVNVIESGMGSREEPLMLIITTAGFDLSGPCKLEYDRAKNILSGHFEDESYFCVIYEMDEGDDWKDEKNWYKANPNLDISVSLEYLRDRFKEAVQKAATKEVDFKTKHLNLWVSSKRTWITHETWKATENSFEEESLEGLPCVGALDLSKVADFSSWTLIFPPHNEGEPYRYLYRYFIPWETIETKLSTDNLLIREWVEKGYITATEGPTIDYDEIYRQIIEDAETYRLLECCYDPYNANSLVSRVEGYGIPCVEFSQGLKHISPAAKEFERFVLDKKIAHNGHPVTSWMMSCAEIYIDANDNIKPVKPDYRNSGKRIDGVITSLMALARVLFSDDLKELIAKYYRPKPPGSYEVTVLDW